MAKEEREEKEEQQEAPKPKSKKKLIIIVAVVVLLAVVGAVVMMGGKKAPAKSEAEVEQEEVAKHFLTFDLEPIIANLSEIGTFIKITLTIEYDPELLAAATSHGAGGGGGYGGGATGGGEAGGGKGGMPPAFMARESQIKDAIIRTISSKKASDLLSKAGKDALKDELMEAINEALGLDEAPVVSIYFREFIIQ